MRANLVPACQHCNSGVKGTTVHGGDPRRFIHPYYDQWAAQAIWFIQIMTPYQAATFKPRPMPNLTVTQNDIVSFHLENVLGSQFHLSMATHWSSLPGQLKIRDPALTSESLKRQIDLELAVALHSTGQNGWQAALLRGIRGDAGAIEYLRREADATELPPMPPML
ncbi:hypothetical protein [Methylobacterium sp. Leaf108]|uniref:hypothetical protein n=1 Tax=Methylobacterium sp. Leaf108 TaxID=1736256 RepID=UPI0012E77D64|nr:hypothetical protein [Methylobacterium sp. Leaf108]